MRTPCLTHLEKEIKKIKTEKERLQISLRIPMKAWLRNMYNAKKEEHPELKRIRFIGYTPEWNDGEECTHDSRIYVNFLKAGSVSLWDVEPELETEYYEEAEEDEDWHDYFKKRLKDFQSIKTSFPEKYEEVIRDVLDTNYSIIITDDNIKIGHYDCGH